MYGDGTVFEIAKTASGYASTPITLVSFNVNNGNSPEGGLIADANGDLFGTTAYGGMYGDGTVFEIAKTASGYASTPTTLVNFNWSTGVYPFASMTIDANSNLFGTTTEGGQDNGTVFEIAKSASGYVSTPITLVSFGATGSNGGFPVGGLITDVYGDLFGITRGGGTSGDGTVFEITGAPADTAVVNGYINAAHDANNQVLTGTAENGSTVTIYDNGTQVGTTTADATTGVWSFPIGQLADASTHSYTVTATDAAGNVSQPSFALNFTVDTTTSESVISDSAVTTGTDGKGYINAHNFNGGSTTLTGTAEAGDAVSVRVNGGSAQAATVAPTGAWSLPLSGLSDGESVSAVATATDPAGNTATSAAFSFTVDTDAGEQAALKLTVTTTVISAANAAAVSFTIAGLQSEDTGAVTFTDVNHKTVVISVTGGQTSYTANLSSLADGTITSSLAVSTDTAGNTFTAVSGTSATLTQLDHWTNTSGGNWTTASSWATWNGTHAVPTGTIDADFDKSGTYTVSINSADTAYALLLNDSGATISDGGKGTLTLVGTGGSSNPNGPLSINAGNFALAGGGLNSGAISIAGGSLTISGNYSGTGAISQAIIDNGTMTISGGATFAGAITGSGIMNIQKGAAATFTGTITGSETFNVAGTMTISGAGRAIISTPVSGIGSFILSNSASLEFATRDSENITSSPGATGSLKFDDSLNAQFFTGQLSGLSTQGGNSVDLADLLWVQGKMSASYNGTSKGGTLTISNGTNKVALNLLGNYIGASWMLSQDGGTGTLVKDPPVSGSLTPCANGGAADSIDLSGIGFGANTTLGYSPNSDNTGGTLTVGDGLHAQSIALLGQYMASSFVMASDGHGGTLITDPPPSQQTLLAHPHA